MQRETWLRPNRRALLVGMIGSTAGIVIGFVIAGVASSGSLLRTLGLCLVVVGFVLFTFGLRQSLRPRIALQGGDLLFYLRRGAPERVPAEFVEGFLLGQGPSYLPAAQPESSQAATIVVRLADRATDYARRDVLPQLGYWCNHYVTIRGTWCEPLSVALVTRLNQRLADLHAAVKKGQGRS